MELRFATGVTECSDPAAVLAGADLTCRWMGFRSRVGMRAYVEEDGSDVVACSVSFAARHAGMLDPARHALAWVPELTQSEVADIARLHALASRTYRKADERRTDAATPEDYDEVLEMRAEIEDAYRSLKRRVAVATGLCGDSGLPLPALLDLLPIDARERVVGGLRVLPRGFPSSEIDAATEDPFALQRTELAALVKASVGPDGWLEYSSGPSRFPTTSNPSTSLPSRSGTASGSSRSSTSSRVSGHGARRRGKRPPSPRKRSSLHCEERTHRRRLPQGSGRHLPGERLLRRAEVAGIRAIHHAETVMGRPLPEPWFAPLLEELGAAA